MYFILYTNTFLIVSRLSKMEEIVHNSVFLFCFRLSINCLSFHVNFLYCQNCLVCLDCCFTYFPLSSVTFCFPIAILTKEFKWDEDFDQTGHLSQFVELLLHFGDFSFSFIVMFTFSYSLLHLSFLSTLEISLFQNQYKYYHFLEISSLHIFNVI